MVNDPIEPQLLVRFLTGEADPAERERVARWLHEQTGAHHIDEEEEWRSFRSRVAASLPVSPNRLIQFHRPFLRVAAVLILLAGIAMLYFSIAPGTGNKMEIASGQQVLTQTLPDGSGITLNKRSALYYHRSYNDKDREVQLTGEAFFNIASNSRLPFIIHLQDLQVEVLGTSFNIKNTKDSTEIIVESGEVRVKKGPLVLNLHAREKVTFTAADPAPVKQLNRDSLYSYYRTKKFVCNGTPLRELVAALNDAYDEHISVPDEKDAQLPITATFTDKTAADLVAIICSTLQLTAVRQGNSTILKKSSPL